MPDKLWTDLKTDEERAEFLRSGAAWETGIIAPSMAADLVDVFVFRASRLGVCVWKEGENGPWRSGCNQNSNIDFDGEDGPEDSFNFCPYCGKALEEERYEG